MNTTIDIRGLSRADVLAALFNAAEAPRLLGALHFRKGPYVMTREDADRFVALADAANSRYGGSLLYGERILFIDYLHGRRMKLDLTDSDSIDSWQYDESAGEGTAQKVIDRLRATGEVYAAPEVSADEWLTLVIEKSLQRLADNDELGAYANYVIDIARHPETQHVAYWDLTHVLVPRILQQGEGIARVALRNLINYPL